MPTTTLTLARATVLFSEPGVSGSALTTLDKESDVLLVRSLWLSELVALPGEPGFLGALSRVRVVIAVLGEVGDVGGEGSTESGVGGSGGEGRDIMRVVMKM